MKVRSPIVVSIAIFSTALFGCSFDTSNISSGAARDSGSPDLGSDAEVETMTPDAANIDAAQSPNDAGILGIMPTGAPSETMSVGRPMGGGSFVLDCPNGSFLYGYESRYLTSGAEGICDLKPKCGKLTIRDGATTREVVPTSSPLPLIGSCNKRATVPLNSSNLECPGETIVAGLDVTVTGYVTAIALRCASLTLNADSNITITPEPSGQGLGELSCGNNRVAFGITGASGWVVDRIGLRCIDVSVNR
ncbi:MAG: hypothetical protein JKY56_21075 [Kofleriaceae bacterium]|nr:hypothetical protein [Kofleriaceae bacterium]